MAHVEISRIGKDFGDVPVIPELNQTVEDGELCVLVGPSGCGKSTLLRMIAGLESVTRGSIRIDGRDVTHLEPAQRGVAMVFQTYALYPHMTVEDNIGFGLKMTGIGRDEVRRRVDAAARTLRLENYLKRKPKALSGGQRQRVAIGRAIVRGPGVFLFDEPLSNLDAELRLEMRVEIARIHKELKATMIHVTHDQVEAMTLADKIVVLRNGHIEQAGRPLDLYNDPDNRFVAGFLGSPSMNFFEGTAGEGVVHIPELGQRTVTIPSDVRLPSGGITVGIRPRHLEFDATGGDLTVELVERLGDFTVAYLRTKAGRVASVVVPEGGAVPANTVGVNFARKDALLFDADTGERIRLE